MSATTDDLVEDVRSLARLPDAGDPDASGILRFADAELVTLLSALMKTAQKDHWLTPQDYACDGSTTTFRLPRRALDRAYHSIKLVAIATGVEVPAFEVPSGNPDALQSFQRYYVEADSIIFSKAPGAEYKLRIRARRRPSKLVPVASCAAISAPTNTTTLAVSTVPSWVAAMAPGIGMGPFPMLYTDIVGGDSPYDLLYTDLKFVSYAAGAVSLDATTPIATADISDVSIMTNGRQDYLCQRDQTCYPPLPEAAFPALVAGTARRVLESLGDPRVSVVDATYRERLKTALDLISPRNDEGSRPIVNKNGSLRGGGGGLGRRVRW